MRKSIAASLAVSFVLVLALPCASRAEYTVITTRELFDIGSVAGAYGPNPGPAYFEAIVVEPPLAKRVFALRILMPAADPDGQDRLAEVSVSDLRTLVLAIDQILTKAATIREMRDYFEAFYETDSGVAVGFFQRGLNQVGFLSVGKLSADRLMFELSGLLKVKELMERTVTKLEELGA